MVGKYSGIVIAISLISPNVLFAHSGRTDSSGGHTNRRTGVYHYHNSGTSSAPTATTPRVRTTYRDSGRTEIRTLARRNSRKKKESAGTSSKRSEPALKSQWPWENSLQPDIREENVLPHSKSNLIKIPIPVTIEDKEKAAGKQLQMAEALLRNDRKAAAIRRMQNLIKKYPTTKASEKAKKILASIR